MSTNITYDPVEISTEPAGDEVTNKNHCVEIETPENIITGVKKEYSIVGDAIYASVNNDDAPTWLVNLIDSIVANQISVGMGNYDTLVQEVRDAISSIDIANNNYVEQIWFDQNIDSLIAAKVTQLNSNLGETYATVTNLELTEASLEQSLAADISQVESNYQNYTDGKVTEINTSLSNAIGTTTASLDALTASFNDPVSGMAATADAVEGLTTFTGQLEDAIVARGEWSVKLDAYLGGFSEEVEGEPKWGGTSTLNDTIEVTSDGRIAAAFQYDAELINQAGDYYKTGFGLITEGGTGTALDPFTSEFWVQADKFKVVPAGQTPNSSDDPIFKVDGTTGQVVVGIDHTEATKNEFKGEYNSGTTYDKGDIVTSGANSYISKVNNNLAHSLSSSLYWDQFVVSERNSYTATGTFASLPTSNELTLEFSIATGESPIKGDTLIYTVESGNDAGNYTAYYTGLDWSSNVALVVHGDAVINGTLSLDKLVASGYVASDNFSSGEEGWAILSNGDAEFNRLNVRASQISGGLSRAKAFNYSGLYASGSTEPYLRLDEGNGTTLNNEFGIDYGNQHPTAYTITNNYDRDATVSLSCVFAFGSGPTPSQLSGGHGKPVDVQARVFVVRSNATEQSVTAGATTMVYNAQIICNGVFDIYAGETVTIKLMVGGSFRDSRESYFYGGVINSTLSTELVQTPFDPIELPKTDIPDNVNRQYRYMSATSESGPWEEAGIANAIWSRKDYSDDEGETWVEGTPVRIKGVATHNVEQSNSNVSVSSDSDGNVVDFSTTSNTLKVIQDGSYLEYLDGTLTEGKWKVVSITTTDCSYSVSDTAKVTAVGSSSDGLTSAVFGPIDSLTADTGSITYNVSVFPAGATEAVTVTVTQSLSKARAGIVGATQYETTIYKVGDAIAPTLFPATAAGADFTYTISTDTLTYNGSNANGWEMEYPSVLVQGNYIWARKVSFLATSDATVADLELADFGSVVLDSYIPADSTVEGPEGKRTASGFVYYTQSSASSPYTPDSVSDGASSPVVYSFVDGSMTGLATNWSTEVPIVANGDVTYWASRFTVVEGEDPVFVTPFEHINFDGLVTFTDISTDSGTTIHGGNITTGSIELTSGAGTLQTLYTSGKSFSNSTAGVFIGFDTSAYKLDIGDSERYFRWDGSALEFKGKLQTDSSGARIEIDGSTTNGNDRIRAFNENGTEIGSFGVGSYIPSQLSTSDYATLRADTSTYTYNSTEYTLSAAVFKGDVEDRTVVSIISDDSKSAGLSVLGTAGTTLTDSFVTSEGSEWYKTYHDNATYYRESSTSGDELNYSLICKNTATYSDNGTSHFAAGGAIYASSSADDETLYVENKGIRGNSAYFKTTSSSSDGDTVRISNNGTASALSIFNSTNTTAPAMYVENNDPNVYATYIASTSGVGSGAQALELYGDSTSTSLNASMLKIRCDGGIGLDLNVKSNYSAAYISNSHTAGEGLHVENNATSATIVAANNGSGIGFYTGNSAYIGGTTYPFTGSHYGLLPNGTSIEQGDIVVDIEHMFKVDFYNALFSVTKSTSSETPAIGVFGELQEYESAGIPENVTSAEMDFVMANYRLCGFCAVGEGYINVCGENGDIVSGDLIVTSSTAGKGMKQNDGIIRNTTVAKSRENVTFTSTSEIKQIACIYLCG